MSRTIFHGLDAARQARHSGAESGATRRRRVPVRVAAGLVVAVGGGLAVAWAAGTISWGTVSPGTASGNGALPAPETQPVTLRALSSQTPVSATLGYAGSYTVTGHGGTLTVLPPPGRVITQGHAIYQVDGGSPVVLLYGGIPAWRTLGPGVSGTDVAQLNHDLAALGDASAAALGSAGWDQFSAATVAGVRELQASLGIASPPGSLSPGSFVFEPTALRIATVPGSLGQPASGPVVTATSAEHVVSIALDTAAEGEVTVGDAVTVTLPDGTVTAGTVSSVGTVATAATGSAGGGSSGSGGTATIPVTVTLKDPSAAGALDQAPVTVNITTETVSRALVVPVGALLAQSPGGYAVEVAGAGNTRRLVPVTVGIFDDTDGLVQVTSATAAEALTAGERVVVPSP